MYPYDYLNYSLRLALLKESKINQGLIPEAQDFKIDVYLLIDEQAQYSRLDVTGFYRHNLNDIHDAKNTEEIHGSTRGKELPKPNPNHGNEENNNENVEINNENVESNNENEINNGNDGVGSSAKSNAEVGNSANNENKAEVGNSANNGRVPISIVRNPAYT